MRWNIPNILNRFGGRKKYYLTKQGLEGMRKEYEALKKLKASKLRGETPEALHSEELSPEYVAFREDLDLLDLRIARLEQLLKDAEVIKLCPKEERDKVHLGAKVRVEVEGQEDEFQIVGTLEADPALGKISNECPVGRALMGHKIGDEVKIQSPIETIYKIKEIKYEGLE